MDNRSEFRKKLPLLVIPIVGVMAVGMLYFMFFAESDVQAEERKLAVVGVVDVNDTIGVANSKSEAYSQTLIESDLKKRTNDNFTFMFDKTEERGVDSLASKSFSDKFGDTQVYNESSFSQSEYQEPLVPVSKPVKTAGGGGSSRKKSNHLKELDELDGLVDEKFDVDIENISKKIKGASFNDASVTSSNSYTSKDRLSLASGNGPSGKLYKASFFNDQKINPNGSQVSIRVNENILLSSGEIIKSNSIIYGTTQVNNSRMAIRVNGINIKGNLIQANLTMVTDEGVEGFPLQESESSIGLDDLNRVGNSVRSISQIPGIGGRFNLPFFSSGGKKNSQKVFIPDGFSFYLIEESL